MHSSIGAALGTGAVGSVPKRPPMAGQRPVMHDHGHKQKPYPPKVMPSPNANTLSAVIWEPTPPHPDQPATCVTASERRGVVHSSNGAAPGTGTVGSVPKRPPMPGQRPVTHDHGHKQKPSPPKVMPSPNAGTLSAVVWEPTLPHPDQPATCVTAPRPASCARYGTPINQPRALPPPDQPAACVSAPCVSGRVWLRLPWPLGRAWRGRPAGLSGWRPASPGGPNGRGWPRWRGAGRASAGWSG